MDIFTAHIMFEIEERASIAEWDEFKQDFMELLQQNKPMEARKLLEGAATHFNVP